MYSFLRTPRWILMHLVIVALAALTISLGLWQLARHDERAERNATVAARSEQPPVALGDLVAEGTPADELRYRPATASGTYLEGRDVLIDNRSFEGRPGAWVVTPLQLDGGDVVAVSRGFQFVDAGGSIDPPPPPAGPVELAATVVPWDGRCGVRTADDGLPAGAACLNRDAVEARTGTEVHPLVLQLVQSAPAEGTDLIPVPLPEPDAGPHRSYAAQWFIFCALGLITYPLLVRRVARSKAIGQSDASVMVGSEPIPEEKDSTGPR